MDAVKLLGSLLGENAIGSKTGGVILESLLGGNAPRGKAPSSAGQPADILSTLLGGKKGSGKGGLAALAAIVAAAAVAKSRNGGKGAVGGGGLGSLLGEAAGKGGLGEWLGGLAGGTGKPGVAAVSGTSSAASSVEAAEPRGWEACWDRSWAARDRRRRRRRPARPRR